MNMSIKACFFPIKLKMVKIIPIGNGNTFDFRPIYILSGSLKIVETY